MPLQMRPWQPTPLSSGELSRFASDIERTFAPLGGRVVGAYEAGRTQRLFFEDIDAFLDITYGPGGRPIVGRGGGFYVPPQLQPRYDKGGGALAPTEVGAWEVLGGAVSRARESAMLDEDPATKFSNFLGYEFGAGRLEEGGWGTYAQWLEPGYERMFPAPALEMLGKTYAAPEVPMGAAAQVYPDVVLMTQGLGGFHKAVKGAEFVEAGIPGAQFAGSKGKQMGTRMYYGGQLGEKPEMAVPWAGGEMRAQILDVMFPLTQATSTVEGQAYVRPGTTVSAQMPKSVALQGWDIERLSQVTGLGQGQFARRGEEFGLIYGAGGEVLHAHREPHWSEVQVTQAHISIPETWAESAWYRGLTEQQRGMFRPTGGAVAGGMVVPSLEYERRMTRGAGGSVSAKGAAFKTLLAERSFTDMIRAGLTPEEAARLDIAYQESPKEWYTAIYAAGVGLGQIQPGVSLFEGGRPREELIRQITGEMGRYVRPVTTFETVTAAQGAEYLAGKVPGVAARALPSGEVELERTFQAYVGPMLQLMRMEYPHGRSVYGGEELEHYRLTNPAMYQAIVQQGQQATAHQGLLRSFWASYGKYEMPAVSYGDVYEQIQGLFAGTGGSPGELVRAMAAGPLAESAIQFSGGAVLPSARDILQMSATDIAGEEVNRLVVSWERAVQAAQVSGYMSRAAEMIGQRGFLKTAQEITVPGAMGTGTARSEIDIGQVLVGKEQFYQYAREFYGRNPTEEQLSQLEAMVRSGNVMTQFTRFPHSDPYAQQNIFLQLGLGWGGQGPQVGPEEIAFHPYHAGTQHGDLDADLYRITSLTLRQAEGGGLMADNAWARQARSMREQVQFMVDQLRETNPEAVAQAEAAAKERIGRYSDQVAGLTNDQRSLMYLGDVVRLTQDFANEMYKHGEKELGKPLGPGEDPGDYITRLALGNLPTVEAATSKMYETWMGKALMGRTYNALIRDIGMRAREMLGPDVAQSIMAIGRQGYQKAVDVAIYDPTMPLGRVEAGQDPRISFGLARLLESWGSQSLFYGGGFAETLTGKVGWEKTRGEYRAPWHGMGTASPWSAARMILGEFAMFGTEGTPQQMSLALTGEERPELVEAITGARSWISTQGLTAGEVLKSGQGQRHLASIYQSAGLTEDFNLATAQGVLPRAMFAMLATRTRETLARDPTMQQDFQRIARDYAQMTGRKLAEDMAEARLDQGTLELLSGRTRHLGEGDLVSQILSMADVARGPLGQGVMPGRREPVVGQDIWASTLGMEDWRRFGSILQRTGRFETGWGGEGTKAHAALEAYFKGRKGYAMEESATYRGAVSEFGVTEYGDVGVTAKPDIVRMTEQGISVFDIKTYELGDIHPEQLLFYGAAMEKKYGRPVSRLAYLRAGEDIDDELLKSIIGGTATEEELAAARKGGILREIDVPKDLQAEAAKMLRSNLQQEEKLRALLPYLSNVELEAHRPGLEGGWKQYQATVKKLHEMATQRQALGIRGGFSPYGESPVDRLGTYYGIDLREMGVRGARVLSPRAFLAEQEEYRDTAMGMSEEEVEKALGKIGYRAGMTKGDTITVRQLTQGEIARYGEDWNPYTIMRGRLAHEAAHVYAERNPELLAAAQAEIDKMDANDPFIQGLTRIYSKDWRKYAASELIAHRLQARFGATVGPLEQEGLSTFERMIVKLAGRIDVGGAGIPVEGAEGAAARGEGAVYYQQRPGGIGGGGASGLSYEEVLKIAIEAARQSRYPSEKELNWDIKTYRAAYRVMSGEEGVLQTPEVRTMAESGLYWKQAQYSQLQHLQSLVEKGGERVTSWKTQNIYRQMQTFAQREDAGAALAVGGEGFGPTIEAGMGAFRTLLGGDEQARRSFKLMAKAGDSVMKFDEAIQRTTETLKYLRETGTDLTQAQKQWVEKIALSDLQSAFTGAARYGGEDFLRTADAREAMEMLGIRRPSLGQAVLGGAERLAKGLMSGWGMIQMQRYWRMTGGQAMGAIGDAAGREQAAMAAAMAGAPLGAYQPGGMALSLMALQAGRADFRADMGEAAYRAWGWTQQALGPDVATLAGIGLPAIGAGLIGGKLATMAGVSTSAGLLLGGGIAAGGGLIGAANYITQVSKDREQLALGAVGQGNLVENVLGGLGQAWGQTPFLRKTISAFAALTGFATVPTAIARSALQENLAGYGAELTSGELAGLAPEGRAAAIRYAAENYAPEWMSQTQAMQSAAQWMAYTPGATNIRAIYEDPLFAQMALRGMVPEQFAGIAQQWNVGPMGWQQIARQQMSVSQGTAMQNEFVLGQWAGLQRLGVSGQAIRQMGYGAPVAAMRRAGVPESVLSMQVGYGGGIGQLPQMTNLEQVRFNRLLGGDRWAWTQYATGNLGLSPDVMQAFQTLVPGAQPADWMITMEPGTGLPMHTTTGRYYGGDLATEASQIGGLRGIQWAQMGAQNRLAVFQEQQQRNAFQRAYAMQTGQMGPLAGGQVSPEFMALSSSVGGMWGLQDAMTNLQARQAMAGFDYQAASLGLQARQFREDWGVKWGRLQIQKGWAEEEEERRERRYEEQDKWWLYRYSYRKDTADIQYGRQMEDLDESIRFATGRQKLHLMKQKERVTEDYSRQAMYMEEEKDYWEKQKEWRDEDIEDAREKREEQQKWAEEDMLRAKRHHEESTNMQMGHIAQQRAFWQERADIEKTRTTLEREYWKDQQKAQADEIEMSQDIAQLQRDLREDQMKLQEDAQDRVALFQIAIDSIGEGMDVLNGRVRDFNNLVRQRQAPESTPIQEGPGPQEYQLGGPVGLLPGGRPMSVVAHEGEYVVPQQGSLVLRDDDRVINLLGRILGVLEEKAMINVVVPGQEARSSGRIAEAAYNRYQY